MLSGPVANSWSMMCNTSIQTYHFKCDLNTTFPLDTKKGIKQISFGSSTRRRRGVSAVEQASVLRLLAGWPFT